MLSLLMRKQRPRELSNVPKALHILCAVPPQPRKPLYHRVRNRQYYRFSLNMAVGIQQEHPEF